MNHQTSPSVLPDSAIVREAAIRNGVCIRPVVARVTDTHNGDMRVVAIPCGSTRESQCPPCADRARRLRMHQCREGWHLEEEPERPTSGEDATDDNGDEDCESTRRVRSTRRRDDVADLPRFKVADCTVGRVFEAPDGKRWRPSTFVTLTLDSYGKVDSDGCPLDPDSYDYRRAALDAIHFPKLVDRFWQNLRRAVGWKVQYFATIEGQRRLAPHLHAAIRGTLHTTGPDGEHWSTRRIVRQVAAATYEQVWWPPHDTPVYDREDELPEWVDDEGGFVDPATGQPLPTWDEALDELDNDAGAHPAHVVRFGTRPPDVQGIIAGTKDADRLIAYLAKYLTKDVCGDYGNDDNRTARRLAHIERLQNEVRQLPCSPLCANWLLYGIQPQHAHEGLAAGACSGKAHQRENLGLGGRRVLVSRLWTAKTLQTHRADRAAVVRAALEAAGINPDDHAQLATNGTGGRWRWEYVASRDLTPTAYARVLSTAIQTRRRWQAEYDEAKERAGPVLA